jgi:hypothetical protein
MQSQHVLEKTEKLTTSIFRQNGQPFFADSLLYFDEKIFHNLKQIIKKLTIDYKHSIIPINQKISVLCDEIHIDVMIINLMKLI